jgi:hypothetical protein
MEKSKVLSSILLVFIIVELNTGDTALVRWTPGDTLVQWHEVRTRWRDVDPHTLSTSFRVDMPTTEATIPRPRSGHFSVEVRACRNYKGKEQCSEWITIDVNGKPKPWIIYWKPPKPKPAWGEDKK